MAPLIKDAPLRHNKKNLPTVKMSSQSIFKSKRLRPNFRTVMKDKLLNKIFVCLDKVNKYKSQCSDCIDSLIPLQYLKIVYEILATVTHLVMENPISMDSTGDKSHHENICNTNAGLPILHSDVSTSLLETDFGKYYVSSWSNLEQTVNVSETLTNVNKLIICIKFFELLKKVLALNNYS